MRRCRDSAASHRSATSARSQSRFRYFSMSAASYEYTACGISETVRPSPDRKSTRLNSSHEWISYAVFCLKKKKNHTKAEGRTSAVGALTVGARREGR